jgi:hypothetical protein
MRRLLRGGMLLSAASMAWRNRDTIKGWLGSQRKGTTRR